jgi:hypothetical protein
VQKLLWFTAIWNRETLWKYGWWIWTLFESTALMRVYVISPSNKLLTDTICRRQKFTFRSRPKFWVLLFWEPIFPSLSLLLLLIYFSFFILITTKSLSHQIAVLTPCLSVTATVYMSNLSKSQISKKLWSDSKFCDNWLSESPTLLLFLSALSIFIVRLYRNSTSEISM